MTVAIRRPCPECRVDDHHLVQHIPAPKGTRAHWPDPAAEHYQRECRWCRHRWDEPVPG